MKRRAPKTTPGQHHQATLDTLTAKERKLKRAFKAWEKALAAVARSNRRVDLLEIGLMNGKVVTS